MMDTMHYTNNSIFFFNKCYANYIVAQTSKVSTFSNARKVSRLALDITVQLGCPRRLDFSIRLLLL